MRSSRDGADARSADFRQHARPPDGRRRLGRRCGAARRTGAQRGREGHRVRARARRRIPRVQGLAEPQPRAARAHSRGFRAGQPLLHRDRRRRPDRAGAQRRQERRRARQRRRPPKTLRLHHALDRRPEPAGDRGLDRRGFADPRADAEGPARVADPVRLRPVRRADERLPGPARDGDSLANHAAPVLGDRARRTDRGGRARGQRGSGENPSCGRDRALGVRARLARGRSLSGRRRPRRPRPRHLPRLPPDAEGRRGALRPPDR